MFRQTKNRAYEIFIKGTSNSDAGSVEKTMILDFFSWKKDPGPGSEKLDPQPCFLQIITRIEDAVRGRRGDGRRVCQGQGKGNTGMIICCCRLLELYYRLSNWRSCGPKLNNNIEPNKHTFKTINVSIQISLSILEIILNLSVKYRQNLSGTPSSSVCCPYWTEPWKSVSERTGSYIIRRYESSIRAKKQPRKPYIVGLIVPIRIYYNQYRQ